VYVESARAGLNPSLLVHTGIAAGGAAVCMAEVRAASTLADAEAATRAGLMRAARRRILDTGDVQVTADIGRHLVARDIGADDVRVATRHDTHAVRTIDMRAVLHGGVAIRIAMRLRHRRRYPKALRAVRHADTRTARLVRATRRVRVRRVDEVDLILRG